MPIRTNPPDLLPPTIQVRFRGLLVFDLGQRAIKVHHDAPQHGLRVAILKTPPSGPSDLTYLPDSAGDMPIVFDVQNPDPRYAGIRKYPPAGSTQYPQYNYDKLLRFRGLSPGHAGATEDVTILSSMITLNHGFFFSAENGDVINALQTDNCRGNQVEVSFVVAANIYLAPNLTPPGKAVLQFAGGSQDLIADGSIYEIEITNLPPGGMVTMSPHFRYYYRAFLGVPAVEQRDICPMHHGPLVTFLHPCIPVDGE